MRVLALLLRLALAAATAPSQLLFNFTEVRYPWSNELQISELKLYDASGIVVASVNATNPQGSAPVSTQMAVQAVDGRVTTKWVDIGFRGNGFSLLYLTPTAGSVVASCTPSLL